MSGLRGVDHPNDLQFDPRRQHVEQPTTTAEQHRDLVILQLVQHPGLETLDDVLGRGLERFDRGGSAGVDPLVIAQVTRLLVRQS